MKREIIALSLLISLSGSAYAVTGQEAQLDAQNTPTVDELVTKMNQASNENKFAYMNEIKDRIASTKSLDRESKMDDALNSQEQEKAHEQNSMEQEHSDSMNHSSESNDNSNNSGSENSGSSESNNGGSDNGGGDNGGGDNGGGDNGGGDHGGSDNGGGDHGDGGHD